MATNWTTKTGSYQYSVWNTGVATAYQNSQVSSVYTYSNATITDLGAYPITVTAIMYVGPSGQYVVPLNGPPPAGTATWLSQNGWSPPQGTWVGWQNWGSGTPLGGGFTGYNWGGLPFLTDGTFAPTTPQGVTLMRGQSLTVPYVPGYEVGFVTSTGNVWWLA